MSLTLVIIVTASLTLFLTVAVFNLKSAGKRIEHQIEPLYDLQSDSFLRSLGSLLGPPLIPGNKIEALENGDEIFPQMLSAISSAKETITFETFIYWSGEIGKTFAKALCDRARAGTRVHVLLDWLGSRDLDESEVEHMKACGVQVKRYRPLRWYNLTRANNRTHRKLLIVDGVIGFTGGVGIADQWQGRGESPDHWRDSHYKVSGPVVLQMQAAFMDNWNTVHPNLLHGDNYFPKVSDDSPTHGGALAQVFKSSPEEGSGSVRLMYLMFIALATKNIRIASAYFVPDSHVSKVLIAASRRGISVEIIVPGPHTDSKISRIASRETWGELLENGIKIFEFQPTMYHCKCMIADDLWVSVGSTNFDNRSFRLNDECNLNMKDQAFAQDRINSFELDKTRCKEITLEDWKRRPIWERAAEKFGSIFHSQV